MRRLVKKAKDCHNIPGAVECLSLVSSFSGEGNIIEAALSTESNRIFGSEGSKWVLQLTIHTLQTRRCLIEGSAAARWDCGEKMRTTMTTTPHRAFEDDQPPGTRTFFAQIFRSCFFRRLLCILQRV